MGLDIIDLRETLKSGDWSLEGLLLAVRWSKQKIIICQAESAVNNFLAFSEPKNAFENFIVICKQEQVKVVIYTSSSFLSSVAICNCLLSCWTSCW